MSKSIRYLLICSLCFLQSCGSGDSKSVYNEPGNNPGNNPENNNNTYDQSIESFEGIPAEYVDKTLLSVEQQVALGNLTIYASSDIWVNELPVELNHDDISFMLSHRLIANVNLYSIQGSPPYADMSNAKLYLLRDNKIVWHPVVSDDVEYQLSDDHVTVVFREGPDFLMSETVDVVLEFQYLDEVYRILQPRVFIDSVN